MRRWISIFTLAAFLLLAALPLYGLLLPGGRRATEENRELAQMPDSVTVAGFPAAFEAYFDDHFAYRSELVKLYNRLQYLTRDSKSDSVAYGKDGWLFYMLDNSRRDILRELRYTPEQLDVICAAQQGIADALAGIGARYCLLLCPDKHTIYPECLPDELPVGEGDSCLDSMIRALRANTDVPVVYPKEAMLAAKGERDLYLRTDTHWNGYGAFVAYRELARYLEAELPGFRALAEEDCAFETGEVRNGGDLAGYVGRASELREARVSVRPKRSEVVELEELPFREPSADPNRPSQVFVNPANPDGPSCVLFRDSFANAMLPLLKEGFSRIAVVWSTEVVEDVVRAEKPDLVIMEYVERLSSGARNGMARGQ